MVAEVDARLLDASVMPNKEGFSGDHGGAFLPPPLVPIMNDITEAYEKIKGDPTFWAELRTLEKHFTGRPSPILHAERLSQKIGGAQIYLKREDLNHTGAHKINHSLGEALLAKRMGKKKLIAETGAGQHGVALATSAALVGLECDIHMGEVDMAKERPNVVRMKILGARVVPATHGLKTLKEAVDSAFKAYMEDPVTQFYAIGSVVGPHPFPMMVRDFQSVVGREAREQFLEMTGKLPDNLELPREQTILVNLSGRGDKDIDYVIEHFGHRYGITATPQAFTETPLAAASGAKRRACEEGDAEMPTANAAGA